MSGYSTNYGAFGSDGKNSFTLSFSLNHPRAIVFPFLSCISTRNHPLSSGGNTICLFPIFPGDPLSHTPSLFFFHPLLSSDASLSFSIFSNTAILALSTGLIEGWFVGADTGAAGETVGAGGGMGGGGAGWTTTSGAGFDGQWIVVSGAWGTGAGGISASGVTGCALVACASFVLKGAVEK